MKLSVSSINTYVSQIIILFVVYLVFELCEGGELFELIADTSFKFTERLASGIVRKVLLALKKCHALQIAHRDLKPENILMQHRGAHSNIKIVDFGLATEVREGTILSRHVGTPYYIAPEVLARKYTEKCDLWSVGVITFTLLARFPPFFGDAEEDIYRRIKMGLQPITFELATWKIRSKYSHDFIRRLLVSDPSKRMTLEEALVHPWILFEGEVPEPAAIIRPLAPQAPLPTRSERDRSSADRRSGKIVMTQMDIQAANTAATLQEVEAATQMVSLLRRFASFPYLKRLSIGILVKSLPSSEKERAAHVFMSMLPESMAKEIDKVASEVALDKKIKEVSVARQQFYADKKRLQNTIMIETLKLEQQLASNATTSPHLSPLPALAVDEVISNIALPPPEVNKYEILSRNALGTSPALQQAEMDLSRLQCPVEPTMNDISPEDLDYFSAIMNVNPSVRWGDFCAWVRKRQISMPSDTEIATVMYGLDLNGDGCLNFVEVAAAIVPRMYYLPTDKIMELFDLLDIDKDGMISLYDITCLLGERYAYNVNLSGKNKVSMFQAGTKDKNASLAQNKPSSVQDQSSNQNTLANLPERELTVKDFLFQDISDKDLMNIAIHKYQAFGYGSCHELYISLQQTRSEADYVRSLHYPELQKKKGFLQHLRGKLRKDKLSSLQLSRDSIDLLRSGSIEYGTLSATGASSGEIRIPFPNLSSESYLGSNGKMHHVLQADLPTTYPLNSTPRLDATTASKASSVSNKHFYSVDISDPLNINHGLCGKPPKEIGIPDGKDSRRQQYQFDKLTGFLAVPTAAQHRLDSRWDAGKMHLSPNFFPIHADIIVRLTESDIDFDGKISLADFIAIMTGDEPYLL